MKRVPVVMLRSADRADCATLWRWRNDPATRQASLDEREIPFDAHTRWLEESLARADRRIFIVQADGVAAGMARLDIHDQEATVSINIAPEWRRGGLGSRALRRLSQEAFGSLGLHRLVAVVKRDNAASRIAFGRAGFTVVDEGAATFGLCKTRLRVVAAIQARMGSTRLPGKALLPIAGRPTIQRIAERLAPCREVDGIVVSTSVEGRDHAIADLAARLAVPCIRGSERDLIERLGRTANDTGADALVRITADCPLVDAGVVDRIVEVWRRSAGRLDYVSNVFPRRTFPDGLDVELLSRALLERLDEEVTDPVFRELLTAYIWRHSAGFEIDSVEHEDDLSALRWTVDYAEDLAFVQAVYERLGGDGGAFRLSDVLSLLERSPELGDLNRDAAGEHRT
jgi:spore coat polysaccharide biosynthesis protein SpsF